MYLLDSDVLIQAKNYHYGFDICPAFWDWIDDAFARSVVCSIEKVGSEITAGSDDLATWAAARPHLFLAADQNVLNSLSVVSKWAYSNGFTTGAINTFLTVADYYLVSHAHAHSCTVVTHETFDGRAQKRIKIPNACKGLSVRCVTPFQMLKLENAQFVLKPQS